LFSVLFCRKFWALALSLLLGREVKRLIMQEQFPNDDYTPYAGPDYRDKSDRSDPRLAQRISEAFHAEPRLDSRCIFIHVYDGSAYLSGVVKSQSHAMLASALADAVDGIRAVKNELRVVS
jgi:BON domain